MSTNSSSARNVSSSSPAKTYHKPPGSNAVPMSAVLVKTGITQKTASTARKSATIHMDYTLFAKPQSTSSRQSEEQSSDSASAPRAKNTSSLSAATSGSGVLCAQALKKRKRPPFYQSEDDMARSDLTGARPGKVIGTPNSSTVARNSHSPTNKKPSAPNVIGDPQGQDDVTETCESIPTPDVRDSLHGLSATKSPWRKENSAGATLQRPAPAPPVIVDLDPPEATSVSSDRSKSLSMSKETNNISRPVKKRQKTAPSAIGIGRTSNIPPEVITIDSDDDEPAPPVPPVASSRNTALVTLIEASGEAAIISTGGGRSSTLSTRPSGFTLRVRSIKESLKIAEAATTLASPSPSAPILDGPHSQNGSTPVTKNLPSSASSGAGDDAELEVTSARILGDQHEPPSVVEETSAAEEILQKDNADESSTRTGSREPPLENNKDALHVPESLTTDVPSEEQSVAADKENNVTAEKCAGSMVVSSVDVDMHELGTQEKVFTADAEVPIMAPSSPQTAGMDQPAIAGNPVEVASTLALERADSEVRQSENISEVSEIPDNVTSQDNTDTTLSSSYQTMPGVALDRDMPGVCGEIIRDFLDLEDKYAREFREQARQQSENRLYVNQEFFGKCVDPFLTPPEELERMVHRLECTIFMLYEEASHYIINNKFYRITHGVLLRGRIDEYFLHDRHTLSLDKRLRRLLQEISVLTMERKKKIMFHAWVEAGQQPLEGKIELSANSMLELVETHKRVSAELERDDKATGTHGDDDQDTDVGPLLSATRHRDVSEMESQLSFDRNDNESRDVEMIDAVGEAVDNLNRRNSLIIKLAAPPTVLRDLDKTSINRAFPATVSPSSNPAAISPSTIPSNEASSASLLLDPRRALKPNARAKSSNKNLKEPGLAHVSSLLDQMNHIGNSRMEQMNVAAKERHDPYLRRIRHLDKEKDKIRSELRQLMADAAQKTAEFDKQLTLLLDEADFLDQEAKLNGLGPNGYLLPDRDLKWEQYQRLHREKADHETDTAAAREKLIRRGLFITDEKRRVVAHFEENREFEKSMEVRKKEFEQMLLTGSFQGPGSLSYAASSNTCPSTREPSAAIGAISERPASESHPETSGSSAPSSIFSEEALSTPATLAPDRANINKAAAFLSLRGLVDGINNGYGSGYGNFLLAGIRDAALLEEGEAPPAIKNTTLVAVDVGKRKKKRTVKGW